MAVNERCGSVVFTEQAAVDVVKPISGDESVPAGGTCETLRGRKGTEREPITTRPEERQGSTHSYYVITPRSCVSTHDMNTVCVPVSAEGGCRTFGLIRQPFRASLDFLTRLEFTLRWYTLPCALITSSLAGMD